MLPVLRKGTALAPMAVPPVNRLADLFDRLFGGEDFFAALPAPTWTTLPLTMWEDEANVFVEVDVPGVAEKDIVLTVLEGELILRAERKFEREAGLYDTRAYGRFEQRVVLPAGVEPDKVEAKLAHGVLTVRLPKCPEAKPRKIAITTEV